MIYKYLVDFSLPFSGLVLTRLLTRQQILGNLSSFDRCAMTVPYDRLHFYVSLH